MKVFKIYVNPQGSHEAVKQGWSWPAWLFGVIWSLTKRLWALSFGLLLSFFMFRFIASAGGDLGKAIDAFMTLGGLVIGICFGAYGNQWREANLLSRGFEYKGEVSAASSESAIEVYLKNRSEKLHLC